VGLSCSQDELTRRASAGDNPDGLQEIYARVIIRHRRAARDMTITTHVCRANFRPPGFRSGGYEPVAETMLAAPTMTAFSWKYDSERAGGSSRCGICEGQQDRWSAVINLEDRPTRETRTISDAQVSQRSPIGSPRERQVLTRGRAVRRYER